jgi:ABC-2 type transport system permease protein
MTGLRTLVRIQWRTGRRAALVWVLALVGSMAGTAISIARLYDTPAKVQTYADAVVSEALVAINGRVEGIDTLGGIVQDEFGFMAAFLMPLLGISLVARATRAEEESGRLEQLLGGQIDRRAPVVATLLVTLVTVGATVVGFVASLVLAGVPTAGSVLYSLSLGGLALVFAALAALLAQLVLHSRGVYGGALAVLLVSYVLRGIGDVTDTAWVWLSPLGWQEKTAPFGDQRWWALAVPLLVGLVLVGAALVVADRRDLGSAVWRQGAGRDRASRRLRSRSGLAVTVHAGSFVGWLVGGVVLGVVMGALAQEVVDAVLGNPALEGFLSVAGADPADGFLATVQLYLAVVATGFLVQSLGVVRREEVEGRLEPLLAGTGSRWRWLGAHTAVVLGGLVALVALSAASLGAATAWSTGESGHVGESLRAGLAYLPAEAVVGAVAVLLVGLLPRVYAVAWAVFGAVAFIAFLGPGLQMPQWLLDLSPTTHVGSPPQGDVEGAALVVLTVLALAVGLAGFVAFRRRAVPAG